jgi:hypothetical protein
MAENKQAATPRRIVRDARFHTQLMIGPKEIVPAANLEHCKGGWLLLVGETPEKKADHGYTWVGHEVYGWTRVHDSNVRFVRYWAPGDETKMNGAIPLIPLEVQVVLRKRGELAEVEG